MKNYKKLITTIIIALIAAAGVVLIKNFFTCRLTNEAMGISSVTCRGHVGTLFVGSSAYRKGIDMYSLSENKDFKDCFMLTYNGNQPFNMQIELEEILKSDVTIDRIVVDFNPSMMDRGADLSDKRLLWDIGIKAKRKLYSELKKREDAGLFLFYDYWVSSNMDYLATYPIAKPLISARYYLGGSAAIEQSEGLSREELDALEVIENPGLNDLQLDAIDAIIDMCNVNGIELIFLESPRYITMAADDNYRAKSDALKEHIAARNIRVITAGNLDFDNTNPVYYADLTHMSQEGSKVLTEAIAKAIAAD